MCNQHLSAHYTLIALMSQQHQSLLHPPVVLGYYRLTGAYSYSCYTKCVSDIYLTNHPTHLTQSKNNHPAHLTQSKNNHPAHLTQSKNNHPVHLTQSMNNHPVHLTQSMNNHPVHLTQSMNNHPAHLTQSKNSVFNITLLTPDSLVSVFQMNSH